MSAVPVLRAASGSAGLIGLGTASGAREVAVVTVPERMAALEHVEFVSRDYLTILGLETARGRLLTDHEAESPSAAVADISEDLWRRRFGEASDVVGRQLLLNGHAVTVVGVIARFRGWQSTPVGGIDIWLPIGIEKSVTGTSSSLNTMIGRLRPGGSLGAIEGRMQGRNLARRRIRARSDGVWRRPPVEPVLDSDAGTRDGRTDSRHGRRHRRRSSA